MNRRQKEQARLTCQISIGLMAGVFSVIPAASAAPVHDAGSSYNTVPAANITTSGTVTNVRGPSTNNVVAWKDFSVGAKETVRFDGGAKTNNYLNVVTGPSTSQIAGKIQGGNDVYIVNPHGVMFGKGAQVDVGNLYVSTENAQAAVNAFTGNSTGGAVITAGTANADVVNLGTLQADEVQVSGKNIRFLDSAKVLVKTDATTNKKKVTLDATGYIHVGNAGGTDAGYTAGGTTTSIDYYKLVNDANDLQAVATSDLSKNYMLSDNIDASSISNFTPIGNSKTPFTGKFDGMFYEVQGLKESGSLTNAGLFGVVDGSNGARIENLGVTGATIATTDASGSVGSIAGTAQNGVLLQNVYSESGTASGGTYAGGLVGDLTGSTLQVAYNTSVVSNAAYNGGLVGTIENGSIIQNAYNKGAVTSTGTDNYGVGFHQGTNTIKNVYNTYGGLALTDNEKLVTSGKTFSSDTGDAMNVSSYTKANTDQTKPQDDPWTNISSDGTTDTTWRIYEGQTTPLLTAFFQGAITADYNYNFFTNSTDTTATSNGLSLAGLSSTSNNGSDITATYNAQYLKIASSSDATKAGTTSDITFSGNVTGSDSNLSINTTGIRNVAVDGNNKAVQQSLIASGQHGYNIIGGGVLLNKRKVAATTGQKLTIKKEYDGTADGTDALGQALNGGSVGIGGLIAGDDVKLTGLTATYGSKGSEAAKDVEYGKPVSLTPSGTVALTGSSAGNYDFDANSLSNVTVTGDITPRKLYASLKKTSSFDKTYDGNSTVTATDAAAATNVQLDQSNIVTGDTVGIDTTKAAINYYDSTGATVSDSNVATNTSSYDIRYTALGLSGADARNYQLVDKTTGNTIYNGYLAATNQAQPATKAYLTASGVINQRVIDPSSFQVIDTTTNQVMTAEKDYDGTSSYSLPTDSKGNYTAKISPTGTSTIADSGVVSGEDIEFTPTGAGNFLQSDKLTKTSQVKDAKYVAVGLNAKAGNTSTNLSNYIWGTGGKTISTTGTYDVTIDGKINPRTITVLVNQTKNIDKTYDRSDAVNDTNASTFGGVVTYASGSKQVIKDSLNGKTPTWTITPTYESKNVKRGAQRNVIAQAINYDVLLSGDNAENYKLVSATSGGSSTGVAASTTAGTNGLELTFAGSASGTQKGIISPINLSSSFAKVTKPYDGTKTVPTAQLSGSLSTGIIGSDDVKLKSGYTAEYQSENVNGDGTTTTINGVTQKNWINYTGLSLFGKDADNYDIDSSAEGLGEITKLTLKAGDFDYTYSTPITKEYDGTDTVTNADTYLTGIKVKSKVSAKRDVFRDTTNPNNIINHTKDISATYDTPNSKGGAAQKLTYKATILDDGSGNFDFSALPSGIADTDTSATGTITARKVKAAPVSTLKKTYDATNTATATSTNPLVKYTYAGTQTGTQSGLVGKDTDNSSAVYKDKRTGYNDADAGTTSDKTVAYTIGINTADATNYEVVDASNTNTVLYTGGAATTNTLSGAGEINKRKLTINFGNTVKSWDGTDVATGNKTAVNATLDDATGNSDGKSGIVTNDGTAAVFQSNLSKIAGNYVNSSGQKQTDAGKGFTVNYSNIDDAFKSTSGTTTTDYGRNYDFSVTGTGTGDIDPLSITGSNLKLDFSGITKEYDGGNSVVGNGSATSYGAADYITTNWVDVDGDGKLTSADVILGGGSQNGPSSGLQSLISSATYDDAQGNAGTKQGVTYVLNLGNINNYSFGSGFSNVSTGSNATASFANDQLTAKTTGDITPRKVVATPVGTITKTYDGTKNLPSTAGTLISYTHYGTKGAGLVGSGDKDASTGAFTQSDAGSGNNLVTYNLAINNAKNYEIVDSSGKATSTATGAGTITKRNLVINFGKTVKTWDGSDVATGNVTPINATLSDSNNGDGLSGIFNKDGTATVFNNNLANNTGITGQYVDASGNSQTDAGKGFKVNYSNIDKAFIDSANKDYGKNYTFSTTGTGTGDIDQLKLAAQYFHLGFNNISKEYDATQNVAHQDRTSTGAAGTQHDAEDYISTTDSWIDVDQDGSYTAGKDVLLGNGTKSGLASIIQSATYDTDGNVGNGKDVTYQLKLKGSNVTFSGNLSSATLGPNVTSLSSTTAANGDVDITAKTTGDITVRKLYTSLQNPTSVSKTYDGGTDIIGSNGQSQNIMGDVQVNGLLTSLDGVDLDRTATQAQYTDKNAGSGKDIIYNLKLTGNNTSNYEIVDTNTPANVITSLTSKGTGNINKAKLTIDFGFMDKTYDTKSDVTTSSVTGDQTTIKPILSGFVNNENASFDATATNLITGSYVKWDAANKQWVADPHVNRSGTAVDYKAIGYSGIDTAFTNLASRNSVLDNYELTGATNKNASVTTNNNGVAQSVYFSEALQKGKIKPLALVMGDIQAKTTTVTKEYDGTNAVTTPGLTLFENKTGQNITIPYTLDASKTGYFDSQGNPQIDQTNGNKVDVKYVLSNTTPFPAVALGDFDIDSTTQAAYQGKAFLGDGIITPKQIYVELDKTKGITKEYNHSQQADPNNVKYYDSKGNVIGVGNTTSGIIESRDAGKVNLSVKSALFDDENASIERKTSASKDARTITYTVDLDDTTNKGNYVLNAGPIPVTGHTQTATSSNKTSKSVTDPTTGVTTTTDTTENVYTAKGDIYRKALKVKSDSQPSIYTNGTPKAYTGSTSGWYTGDTDSNSWTSAGGDSQLKWGLLPGTSLGTAGAYDIYGWYHKSDYTVTTTTTTDPTTGALLTTTDTITRPDGSILTRVTDATTGKVTLTGVDSKGTALSQSALTGWFSSLDPANASATDWASDGLSEYQILSGDYGTNYYFEQDSAKLTVTTPVNPGHGGGGGGNGGGSSSGGGGNGGGSTPSTPTRPSTPSTPSTPSRPSTPSTPSTPASTPTTPVTPTTPTVPATAPTVSESVETSINSAKKFVPDSNSYNYASHDEIQSVTRSGQAGLEYTSGGINVLSETDTPDVTVTTPDNASIGLQNKGSVVNLSGGDAMEVSASRVDLTGGDTFTITGDTEVVRDDAAAIESTGAQTYEGSAAVESTGAQTYEGSAAVESTGARTDLQSTTDSSWLFGDEAPASSRQSSSSEDEDSSLFANSYDDDGAAAQSAISVRTAEETASDDSEDKDKDAAQSDEQNGGKDGSIGIESEGEGVNVAS